MSLPKENAARSNRLPRSLRGIEPVQGSFACSIAPRDALHLSHAKSMHGPGLPLAMDAPRFSLVLETPAASPAEAERHFAAKLAFETDPSDVKADLDKGSPAFVVVDCRSKESFARGHVPGAISLPYRTMDAASTAGLPRDKTVVAYCTSVHCNASAKGALRLARLGFRVKEMVGGLRGWEAEGYPVQR